MKLEIDLNEVEIVGKISSSEEYVEGHDMSLGKTNSLSAVALSCILGT